MCKSNDESRFDEQLGRLANFDGGKRQTNFDRVTNEDDVGWWEDFVCFDMENDDIYQQKWERRINHTEIVLPIIGLVRNTNKIKTWKSNYFFFFF